MAEHIGMPSVVIPNPYQDDVFRLLPELKRTKDLIFVGRLVSDKGVDLLIRALVLLRQRGLEPMLTVVGDGPEREALQELVNREDLEKQVHFLGALPPRAIARALNEHRIVVVPSRWAEPFGLVALEGIACGCVVIGSEQGGLAEAIGPCGLTFPNGDVEALADRLAMVLTESSLCSELLQNAETHLAPHRRKAVAGAYLEMMRGVLA